MTFTNRVGENLLLKLSSNDEPKTLWVSDTRVSFVHLKVDGPLEIQVSTIVFLVSSMYMIQNNFLVSDSSSCLF